MSDFVKMHKEIANFSESYTKNSTLGTEVVSTEKIGEESLPISTLPDVEEKNAYGDANQREQLKSTFFNEELGIMMEKMPEGVSRSDLWQILRE